MKNLAHDTLGLKTWSDSRPDPSDFTGINFDSLQSSGLVFFAPLWENVRAGGGTYRDYGPYGLTGLPYLNAPLEYRDRDMGNVLAGGGDGAGAGTTRAVQFPRIPEIDVGTFSPCYFAFTLWFRLPFVNSGVDETLMSFANSVSPFTGTAISYDSGNQVAGTSNVIAVNYNSVSATGAGKTIRNLGDGQWHLLCSLASDAQGTTAGVITQYLYVDGLLDATWAENSAFGGSPLPGPTTSDLFLAGDNQGDPPLSGQMCDFRIYDGRRLGGGNPSAWGDTLNQSLWNPETRWELYSQPRRSWFFAQVAPAVSSAKCGVRPAFGSTPAGPGPGRPGPGRPGLSRLWQDSHARPFAGSGTGTGATSATASGSTVTDAGSAAGSATFEAPSSAATATDAGSAAGTGVFTAPASAAVATDAGSAAAAGAYVDISWTGGGVRPAFGSTPTGPGPGRPGPGRPGLSRLWRYPFTDAFGTATLYLDPGSGATTTDVGSAAGTATFTAPASAAIATAAGSAAGTGAFATSSSAAVATDAGSAAGTGAFVTISWTGGGAQPPLPTTNTGPGSGRPGPGRPGPGRPGLSRLWQDTHARPFAGSGTGAGTVSGSTTTDAGSAAGIGTFTATASAAVAIDVAASVGSGAFLAAGALATAVVPVTAAGTATFTATGAGSPSPSTLAAGSGTSTAAGLCAADMSTLVAAALGDSAVAGTAATTIDAAASVGMGTSTAPDFPPTAALGSASLPTMTVLAQANSSLVAYPDPLAAGHAAAVARADPFGATASY